MIVKEKDACMYDCPQKLASGADVSFTMCRGQGCMAWRWAIEGDPSVQGEWWRSKTHGYCGLAGLA